MAMNPKKKTTGRKPPVVTFRSERRTVSHIVSNGFHFVCLDYEGRTLKTGSDKELRQGYLRLAEALALVRADLEETEKFLLQVASTGEFPVIAKPIHPPKPPRPAPKPVAEANPFEEIDPFEE